MVGGAIRRNDSRERHRASVLHTELASITRKKDRPEELCLDNAFVLIEGYPFRVGANRVRRGKQIPALLPSRELRASGMTSFEMWAISGEFRNGDHD